MNSTEQPITEDDLFRYQRHRWLYVLWQIFYFIASTDTMSRCNDAQEQDLRYRSFNVTALVERALKAKRTRTDGLKCMFLSPNFHAS